MSEVIPIFARARKILAHSNHKIFSVSRKHFRTPSALLAIRPPDYKQGLSGYVIRVRKDRLEIGWLQPDAADKSIRDELCKQFGKKISLKPRMFNYIRAENWHELRQLVSKEQREEFDVLFKDAQLL